jgi:hypothetical protein
MELVKSYLQHTEKNHIVCSRNVARPYGSVLGCGPPGSTPAVITRTPLPIPIPLVSVARDVPRHAAREDAQSQLCAIGMRLFQDDIPE